MAVIASKGDHARADATRRRPARSGDSRPRKALTIGAVAKILSQEFDDISISKIRYLEDQKLLAPRRTAGGYRLYSQADVERLRAILRMQRDEFLPLRVIRQELATGDFTGTAAERREPEAPRGLGGRGGHDLLARGRCSTRRGVGEQFLRSFRTSGSSSAKRRDGRDAYDETDLEIVRAAAELSSSASAGATCACSRRSADREAALLEQLVSAQLRSRSQARRKEAIENLESLAAVCGHLKHLLLVRDLRRLKANCRVGRVAAGVSRSRVISRRSRTASGIWSPTRTTCRAGGRGPSGSRTCAAPSGERAPVDHGARDRARHRRASRLPLHRRSTAEQRYAWEQQIEGSPFERVLREARTGDRPRRRRTRAPRSR